jgi:GNAT superfamily N-acetyltransferase
MRIRVATEADIPEMGHVRMSVRENRLPILGSLQAGGTERMPGGDGCGWVAEVDGRVVGFAIADLSGANVYALFVEPDFERREIGRMLHDAMMGWFFSNQISSVWLSTDPGTRAERFYRNAGWILTGEEANGEIRFEMSRDRCAASTRTFSGCVSLPTSPSLSSSMRMV